LECELTKAKIEMQNLNVKLKVYKDKETEEKIEALFKELEKYGFQLESISQEGSSGCLRTIERHKMTYTLIRNRN